MSSLKMTQNMFQEVVVHPRPSFLTKDRIRRAGFVSEGPVPVAKRLEIYRYAYGTRLYKALESDFPHFEKKIGKRKFKILADTFISTHMSRYYNLSELTFDFVKYLETTQSGHPHPHYVLAKLDWMRLLAKITIAEEQKNLASFRELLSGDKNDFYLTVGVGAHLLDFSNFGFDEKHVVFRDFDGYGRSRRLDEKRWTVLKYIKHKKPTLDRLSGFFARMNLTKAFAKSWLQWISHQSIVVLCRKENT